MAPKTRRHDGLIQERRPFAAESGAFTHDAIYRMPAAFGPAPGPRNLPIDRRHLKFVREATMLTVTAFSDGHALTRLLPAGLRLEGEPRIEVGIASLSNIGWLAGRGYNLIAVTIPVTYDGDEQLNGGFVAVMWENLADCLLTGRDELGAPKIFADIPPLRRIDGSVSGEASWEGFGFFRIEGAAFQPADPPAPSPTIFHKYIPRTGALGDSEVDALTVTGPDGASVQLRASLKGRGSFSFNPARWEDMPTQYLIVDTLASLPILGFGDAWLIESSGGGDLSGQRPLR